MAASPLCPASAYADVRLADQVFGETVESRDLSVAQCPSIDAEYVYVVGEDGTVYFSRNGSEHTQIASITKVMTAIVALENAELSTQITVSDKAASIGESTAALQSGDVLTLDQALTALLVSSGNDAAQAIGETLGAQWASGDQSAMDAFVAKMNETAARLGMTESVFENPHGLDFDDYAGDLHSTAQDVSTMCAYAMQNETFRNIVKQPEATVTVMRDGEEAQLELTSTDQMLEEYDGACGIKTGFTALAGASFAGACERDGELLYAIVVNSSSESQRFYDCETLFDWVYEHQVDYKLAQSSETVQITRGETTETVPLAARVAHLAWPDKTVSGVLENTDETVRVFDLNGNISQEVTFNELTEDVHEGDVIGNIVFKQHNEVIAQCNIVACEDVAAPNMFEGIQIWFSRLFSNKTADEQHAQSCLLNETSLLVNRATS